MRSKNFIVLTVFVAILATTMVMAVEPFGAAVTSGDTSRAPQDSAGNNSAIAGNITELTVFGYSTTQSWQGYFGNVTGTIQLADSSDNVMYNWSLASPEGEIYSTTASSVNWTGIACFNWATNGAALEGAYNIVSDDVDGIDETFSTGNGHDTFYTNNVQFATGTCMSTKIYDNSKQGVEDHFEEVLLTDGSAATNVIFTSLLEEDVAGFDNRAHDFQMLVLEDGHATDTSTTTYYFYVELE